ncbi:MAG: polymer-forming cytoskeletal protein [Candidatus Saganbacteria bacterium]|nr:polymer-forming cytoskeletal protein [Candidatus Saganbacteria bacterium]
MGIFGIEKKMLEHEAVDTIIGGKAKFKGELNSAGAVSVNGHFEGKLNAGGDVIISRGSKIAGDIKGKTVIVSGNVDGNISASHSLEITKNGRVHGDLIGGKIIIEEGSSYRGKVRVESSGGEEKDEQEEKEEEGEGGKALPKVEDQIEIVAEEPSAFPAQDEVTLPQMF